MTLLVENEAHQVSSSDVPHRLTLSFFASPLSSPFCLSSRSTSIVVSPLYGSSVCSVPSNASFFRSPQYCFYSLFPTGLFFFSPNACFNRPPQCRFYYLFPTALFFSLPTTLFFALTNAFFIISSQRLFSLSPDGSFFCCQKAGVENFVFISAAGAQHEHLVLNGYWKGKRKAEAAILARLVLCVSFLPDNSSLYQPHQILIYCSVGEMLFRC